MLAELESPLPLDGVNMARRRWTAGRCRPTPPSATPGTALSTTGANNVIILQGLMRPDMHDRALRTLPDERCAALEQYDPLDMLCAEGRTETRDSACNVS
ncbi:hypothetical protein MSG28_003572 [Choristoneura fumiferana]|uniref:Uncharacterized protein n=1 Tax=Choristoneura fumiferana TaxID=7141 RepID=A0ACC0KG82_CHOFU|nr:hypothetical protein MSG28_003572 [Choristoneura fumiferana]